VPGPGAASARGRVAVPSSRPRPRSGCDVCRSVGRTFARIPLWVDAAGRAEGCAQIAALLVTHNLFGGNSCFVTPRLVQDIDATSRFVRIAQHIAATPQPRSLGNLKRYSELGVPTPHVSRRVGGPNQASRSANHRAAFLARRDGDRQVPCRTETEANQRGATMAVRNKNSLG
jgi:hypothetical protein